MVTSTFTASTEAFLISGRPTRFARLGAALLTVASLAALAVFFDWSTVAAVAQNGHGAWILAACLCFAVSLFARAARFRSLLSLPWRSAFDLMVVNNLGNQLLPFRMGEALFLGLGVRRGYFAASDGVVGLLLARLCDLLALVFLAAFVGATLLAPGDVISIAGMAVLAAAGMFYLGPGIPSAFASLGRVLLRRGFGGRPVQWLAAKMAMAGARQYSRTALGRATLAAAMSWFGLYSGFYCVLKAFSTPLGYAESLWASSGAVVAGWVPWAAPGGVGLLEAGWAGGLVARGMPLAEAVSSGVLMHVLVIAVTATAALPLSWTLITNNREEKE